MRVVKSHALIISRCFSRLKLLGRSTHAQEGKGVQNLLNYSPKEKAMRNGGGKNKGTVSAL